MNLNLHKFTLKDLNFIEARRYLYDFAKTSHLGNDFGVISISLFLLFPIIGLLLNHFKIISNHDVLTPSLVSALCSFVIYYLVLCKVAFNHKQKFLYGMNYFQEIIDASPNKSQLTHDSDIKKQCLFCCVCDTDCSVDLHKYGYKLFSSHPVSKVDTLHCYTPKDRSLIQHDFFKISWIEDNKRQELLEKDKNTKFEMEF